MEVKWQNLLVLSTHMVVVLVLLVQICSVSIECATTSSPTPTNDPIYLNATFVNCYDIITNNAVVNYTEPTATDGEDDLNVSCDPPSGTSFTENENMTVTCTASDAAGNEANETCEFLVTVDTILPSFAFCPDDSDHFADAGTNSTVVTWENPTAVDNLFVEGFPAVNCSPESGSRLEIGRTDVVCTATDAVGNVQEDCNIRIYVEELSPPTIDNINEITNETMLVTWTSADAVERFTIVYTGASGSEESLNVSVTGEETSKRLTELLSGETYTVTVTGEIGLALAESEPRIATTELNAPTITSTSSSQMTSLRIEWSSPPKDIVKQYNVTYTGLNEDLEMRTQMEDGSSTSTTLDGLLSGETYRLTVTAFSGSLEGMEVSATSAEQQETTVPRNLTLEESDSTVSSVTVQWSPPSEPESTLTPVIEFYTIDCSAGQASPGRVNFSESDITASCVNLTTPGGVYTVTVTSHSQGKEASSSIMIIAYTISPNATFADCPSDVITNNAVVNYTQPTATDGEDDLSVLCDPPSGTSFTENKNVTVTCTASDAAGNEANKTCEFLVFVDTISPNATFFNCPSDVITNNAVVNYTQPTATDGEDELSVSCDPPSGFKFTENENTNVTCTASDAAGNKANRTCKFLVTVDTISPNATFANCPSDVITNNVVVNYTQPTATDGEDDLSVSCDPPSGTNFTENENTTVTCTASDVAGNEAKEFCIFFVTVDTISPNATFANCPVDVITNNAVVNYTQPTATDGEDDLSVSCDPPSGTKFTENENTTVTCTASDAAGNKANETCEFLVTVDTILPSFTFCPDDSDHFADAGTNSTIVTWENPTAVDNLFVEGFPAVNCSPESGSRLEIGRTDVVCTATDAAGNVQESCNIRIYVEELSPPTIDNINEITNETMLVTWTSADAVKRFTIGYTGASGSEESLNVSVAGNETSKRLTELLPGETYTVTVTGEIGLALAESEPRVATTELNAPTITSTSSSQMTSLRIEWSSPPKDIVKQYNVTYTGLKEDLETRTKMEDGSSTSTTLDGLLSGETYRLMVTAFSGSLEGMEVSAMSAEQQETTVPRNVTLEESDSTVSSVTVQWSPPSEPESTLTPVIEFYTIDCSAGQASPGRVNFSESDITASCVDLTTPGGVYTVTVTSHSQGKEASSSIMIIALPNGVMLYETQPTTTTIVSTKWSYPGGEADSFEVECSEGTPSPSSIPIKQPDTELDYTASCINLLSPGKGYVMTVFVNSGGKKSNSSHIRLTAVPEAVEGLMVKDITNSEAVVSWRTPVNCATCVFTSFRTFRTDNVEQPQTVTFVKGQTDYEATFGTLVAGSEYTFTVIAQSGDKESINRTTTQRIKPSPVTGFEPPIVTATSIKVSWKDVDGVKDKYTLSIQPEEGSLLKPNPLNTTAVFTDLKPVTLYTITVKTHSGQEESEPYSETVKTNQDIPVPPVDKPSIPTTPTTTSFVVEMKDSYFSHVNGEIQNYTVIVAQEANTMPSVPDPARTWAAAQDKNPIPPYQAFVAKGYPFPSSASSTRKKRQAVSTVSIAIGVSECKANNDVYCNGHLRDDTSYIYLFRVWNDAGYTDSPFSQPIRTVNDTTLEVGLGVGIPLCILFIVFIVLLLLVIRRRRQLQKGGSATAYANEAFSNDVQMPLRKRANSRPIHLDNFPEHFRVMKADSEYLFSEEYEELRPVGRDQPTEAALQNVNRSKNRFVNILPYDHSRVKLSQVDDEEGSDYINANFIPGYSSPREFIACQGPLPGTVDDIWRLAWEQRVSTIVMVTQLVEKGRVKCHRYWPVDDEPVYFGEIMVTLLTEKVLKQWTVREFQLQKDEKKRKLRHFNFTAWPDHGVPENSEGILRFVRSVRNQISQNRRPTIVHCSAGVGRTGTFITLDRLTQHLKENEYVDVYGIVSEMRMHRNYMVQTEQQYIFIHDCVMQLLQGGVTNGEPHRENMV